MDLIQEAGICSDPFIELRATIMKVKLSHGQCFQGAQFHVVLWTNDHQAIDMSKNVHTQQLFNSVRLEIATTTV